MLWKQKERKHKKIYLRFGMKRSGPNLESVDHIVASLLISQWHYKHFCQIKIQEKTVSHSIKNYFTFLTEFRYILFYIHTLHVL